MLPKTRILRAGKSEMFMFIWGVKTSICYTVRSCALMLMRALRVGCEPVMDGAARSPAMALHGGSSIPARNNNVPCISCHTGMHYVLRNLDCLKEWPRSLRLQQSKGSYTFRIIYFPKEWWCSMHFAHFLHPGAASLKSWLPARKLRGKA